MTAAAHTDAGRASSLFHALADQIRLDVIDLLVGGERCVCELMSELGLAQSRLSWHLKTLTDAGIIRGRREGRWNYYSLNLEALDEARAYLDATCLPRRRTQRRSAACCD